MKLYKPIVLLFFVIVTHVFGQNATYRATKEKIHDLQHTKLKVDFNFSKKTMNGEAWVTLKPHFYPTNQLVLDAKSMIIHAIELENKSLDYYYDQLKLTIDLPREYKKNESYTIYIKYTAQPEKVIQKGSAAITKAKGLYFINADGFNKNKPTQIWTQGETESSSCWFPTIDAPNQKTSQEIYIRVPNKYVTLSNGDLISQIEEGENRTDYWKFDKKHAPYLFFMGIGEYEIIKDEYKNIPVNYYVEKEYAPYAKDIFGKTPEIIDFFATITGVPYPWNKYSQMVVRDYVSGAMENTTAVVHGESAYQMPGQLIDENKHEDVIVHEVFHHWFGNLVTTESWSNIALNEAFANYGEYLWRKHAYGQEHADSHWLTNVEGYKSGQNLDKHLVRFYYENKEDVFDAVSYNKGGAVLRMLHSYLGDDAFYTGLQKYLETYQYQAAEIHQFRIILEEITGKDLNGFFNEWFYNNGHPKVEVSYDYNPLEKTVTVNIVQLQKDTFQFPLAIDIFENNKSTRHNVFVDGKDASFKFPYTSKNPNLILVNADGVLLADFIENKILSEFIFQLKYAKSYVHKREALLEIAKKQDEKIAFNAIANAMSDDFYEIRKLALEKIDLINKFSKQAVIDKITTIVNSDPKTLVQAAAIETLGKLTDPVLLPVFTQALESKSYAVLGKALVALYYVDKTSAIQKSKELPNEVRQILATPLTRIFIEEKDIKELAFIAKNVLSGMYLSNDNQVKGIYQKAFQLISESNNTEAIANLVDDMVIKGNQYKQFNFDKVVINLMRQMVQTQKKKNGSAKNKNIEIIKTGMAKLL